MLVDIWHLSLKTGLSNGTKYSNIHVINHPLTLLCINQVDKYIFLSHRVNMTLNVGFNSRNNKHILRIIKEQKYMITWLLEVFHEQIWLYLF